MARSADTDTTKKPRFTVAEAAAAFRLARGDNKKIERIKDEKRRLRRDKHGYLVLVKPGDPPSELEELVGP